MLLKNKLVLGFLIATGLITQAVGAQEINLGQYSGIYKLKNSKNAAYCPPEVRISGKNKRQLKISERMIFKFNNRISADVESEFNAGYVFKSHQKVSTENNLLLLEISDTEVCKNGTLCKVDHLINGSKENLVIGMDTIRYTSANTYTIPDEKTNFVQTKSDLSQCEWNRVEDKK